MNIFVVWVYHENKKTKINFTDNHYSQLAYLHTVSTQQIFCTHSFTAELASYFRQEMAGMPETPPHLQKVTDNFKGENSTCQTLR